jgi:dCTP deaminase
MLLTGPAITAAVRRGDITLDPFDIDQVNPNSYNYRLGWTIKKAQYSGTGAVAFVEERIDADGLVLEPHVVYLAATAEVVGSKKYAMSLIGRSSMGRLGLFLQVSANLGHTGSVHNWTLELVAAHPVRIYPGMVIGQLTFWNNCGTVPVNTSFFATQSRPTESHATFAGLDTRVYAPSANDSAVG